MSSFQKLIKDVFVYLPAKFLPAFLTLLTIPILTRYLTTEEYGLYSLILSTINIVVTVSAVWLRETVLRYYSYYDTQNQLDTFYSNVAAAMIPSLALGVFLFTGVGLTLDVTPMLLILSIGNILCQVVDSQLFALLRVKDLAAKFTYLSIVQRILNVGIGLILVVFIHWHIDGVLLGLLIGNIMSLMALIYILKNQVTFNWSLVNKGILKQFLSFGVPLGVMNLSAFILSSSDRYVITYFFNKTEVAIYSVAYSLADTSIRVLLQVFLFALGPILFQTFDREGKKHSEDLIGKVVRLYILLFVPLAFGFASVGRPVMHLVTVPEYFAGQKILLIVALGIFFHGLTIIFNHVFTMLRDSVTVMKNFITVSVLNLVLNVICVPFGGYYAAAFTTLASYLILFVITLRKTKQQIELDFPVALLFKSFIASTMMYFIVRGVLGGDQRIWVLAGSILLGVVVYVGQMVLYRGFAIRDLKMLKNTLSR